MKSVGIQYLEAIRRLKQNGQTFKRTLHVSFVPDEEIGGELGMKEFVHTDDFKSLNVGFSLDEGCASPTDRFFVFPGERAIWHVSVHCHGQPGHGSLLLPNTAGEKIRVIIDRFMDLRAVEAAKLVGDGLPGDVLSINLNQLQVIIDYYLWFEGLGYLALSRCHLL